MRNLVNLAKSTGNGASLLSGSNNVSELQADLAVAISQALIIASWFEHLSKDEIPPEWMWILPWELEAWFETIEMKRKEKYGIKDDDEPMQESSDDYVDERAAALKGWAKR